MALIHVASDVFISVLNCLSQWRGEISAAAAPRRKCQLRQRCVKKLQLRRAVTVRWIFPLYLCKNILLKMPQKSGLLNQKNFHLTAPLKQAVFVSPETHNNLKTTCFCSEKPPAKEFYSRMVINCFWSPNPRSWCRQVYGSLRAACVFIHCKFVESGLCDNNVDHNPFMRCRKVAFYWNTSVWEFLIVSA